jgi:hypothetical protein
VHPHAPRCPRPLNFEYAVPSNAGACTPLRRSGNAVWVETPIEGSNPSRSAFPLAHKAFGAMPIHLTRAFARLPTDDDVDRALARSGTGSDATLELTISRRLSHPSNTRTRAGPRHLGAHLLREITRSVGRGESVRPCCKQPNLGTEGLACIAVERGEHLRFGCP